MIIIIIVFIIIIIIWITHIPLCLDGKAFSALLHPVHSDPDLRGPAHTQHRCRCKATSSWARHDMVPFTILCLTYRCFAKKKRIYITKISKFSFTLPFFLFFYHHLFFMFPSFHINKNVTCVVLLCATLLVLLQCCHESLYLSFLLPPPHTWPLLPHEVSHQVHETIELFIHCCLKIASQFSVRAKPACYCILML